MYRNCQKRFSMKSRQQDGEMGTECSLALSFSFSFFSHCTQIMEPWASITELYTQSCLFYFKKIFSCWFSQLNWDSFYHKAIKAYYKIFQAVGCSDVCLLSPHLGVEAEKQMQVQDQPEPYREFKGSLVSVVRPCFIIKMQKRARGSSVVCNWRATHTPELKKPSTTKQAQKH